MNFDLLLQVYSSIGSTVAFVLAYLEVRDRYPHITVHASTTKATLPVGPQGTYNLPTSVEVPVIQVNIFNHGKTTMYPTKVFVMVGRKAKISITPYDIKNPDARVELQPLIPDRSFGTYFYGQDILDRSSQELQESKRISIQVVCAFENGKQFKSNLLRLSPVVLQSHIDKDAKVDWKVKF